LSLNPIAPNSIYDQEYMSKPIVASLLGTHQAIEVNEPDSDGLKPSSINLNIALMRGT
jgi:hypothetical protein